MELSSPSVAAARQFCAAARGAPEHPLAPAALRFDQAAPINPHSFNLRS